MTLRQFLRDRLLPPVAVDALRSAMRWLQPHRDGLVYAPQGWQTPRPPGEGFESAALMECDLGEWHSQWKPYDRNVSLAPWAPIPGDAATWSNFACALALAAHGRRALRVLDYGGGLCPLRIVAKAILPRVALEFHCKEVPAVVSTGRILHPEVTWHDDDACLGAEFDLVVFGSVLQYVKDWRSLLKRGANSARGHVYIADTPVVMNAGSFVAVQRIRGASLLAEQINRHELMEAASGSGLRPIREFPPQAHVPIASAPEQPAYFSCLFERAEGAA